MINEWIDPREQYPRAPHHRNRFPSLNAELDEFGDDLVAHLNIPDLQEMGARHRRGRNHTIEEERRANATLIGDNVQPASFVLSTNRMRRGIDIFMPRSDKLNYYSCKLCRDAVCGEPDLHNPDYQCVYNEAIEPFLNERISSSSYHLVLPKYKY